MNEEQLTLEIHQLRKELDDLKGLFFKDNYSNLEVFRKKVQFKADVDLNNLNDLISTGGTAVIADGNHVVAIPDGGGNITIVTKNGIITSIT